MIVTMNFKTFKPKTISFLPLRSLALSAVPLINIESYGLNSGSIFEVFFFFFKNLMNIILGSPSNQIC